MYNAFIIAALGPMCIDISNLVYTLCISNGAEIDGQERLTLK